MTYDVFFYIGVVFSTIVSVFCLVFLLILTIEKLVQLFGLQAMILGWYWSELKAQKAKTDEKESNQ